MFHLSVIQKFDIRKFPEIQYEAPANANHFTYGNFKVGDWSNE